MVIVAVYPFNADPRIVAFRLAGFGLVLTMVAVALVRFVILA
jgi:hypothetical protein